MDTSRFGIEPSGNLGGAVWGPPATISTRAKLPGHDDFTSHTETMLVWAADQLRPPLHPIYRVLLSGRELQPVVAFLRVLMQVYERERAWFYLRPEQPELWVYTVLQRVCSPTRLQGLEDLPHLVPL